MTPVYDIQPPLELLKKGKAAEAIPMLESLTKRMPSHVSCHVLLAKAYAEEERWQEALSAWQNASFLMPNSPAIRKGFRDALNILSRETIKLIAMEPEPEVEQPGAKAEEQDVGEAKQPEETGSYQPNKIVSQVPPSLTHLASDEASIGEDEELDDLIEELESARIVPRQDQELIESPSLEADIDDVVSETLARIYEGQKQFDEAARVYEKLADMQPDRAEDFMQRAAELRERSVKEAD